MVKNPCLLRDITRLSKATIKEIETSVSTTKPLDYQDLVCPDSTVKNTFGKLCQICFKYPLILKSIYLATIKPM